MIIINISLLCCQLVKFNHLYYTMITRTLVLFTPSHNIHPLFKQSGISNVLVCVPLVLHGMVDMLKLKIHFYTFIKINSVTIIYVYMYFLFYNVGVICVLICLGVVCSRHAGEMEHAHSTVHIVSIIHIRGYIITSIN